MGYEAECETCDGKGYLDTGEVLGGTVTCKDRMGSGISIKNKKF